MAAEREGCCGLRAGPWCVWARALYQFGDFKLSFNEGWRYVIRCRLSVENSGLKLHNGQGQRQETWELFTQFRSTEPGVDRWLSPTPLLRALSNVVLDLSFVHLKACVDSDACRRGGHSACRLHAWAWFIPLGRSRQPTGVKGGLGATIQMYWLPRTRQCDRQEEICEVCFEC